jgi:hypothetical protein
LIRVVAFLILEELMSGEYNPDLFVFLQDLREMVDDQGIILLDVDCFLYDVAKAFRVSPEVVFFFFYSAGDATVEDALLHLRRVEG